ncbi:MAG: hypothetical protein WD595_00520 [Waddliaceae bacterium]
MQVNELRALTFEDICPLLTIPEEEGFLPESSLNNLKRKYQFLKFKETATRLKHLDQQIRLTSCTVEKSKELIVSAENSSLKNTDFYRNFVFKVCRLMEIQQKSIKVSKSWSKESKELELKLKKNAYFERINNILEKFNDEFKQRIEGVEAPKKIFELIARFPYQLQTKLEREHILKNGAGITAQEYTAILTDLLSHFDIYNLHKVNDCMQQSLQSKDAQTRYYATQIDQVLTYLSLKPIVVEELPEEEHLNDQKNSLKCPLLSDYS